MNRKAIRLKSLVSLPRLNRVLALVAVLSVSICLGQSQNKEELQAERDRISKEIALTNKLLSSTRANRTEVEGSLSLINKKINLREDLIQSMKTEIALYSKRIEKNKQQISELEKDLEELKTSYARAIQFAHRSNRDQDKLLYIFASEDFFQAIRRLRYLQQYAEHRQRQASQIEEAQKDLNTLNASLLEIIEEKDNLIKNEEKTRAELREDLREQESAVSSLKQEERKLLSKLKEQEKQRENLNKEIQRIIEAEIRASKKDNAGVFALTPEAAALSAEFESNKGKLPWPVERGVITGKFGANPHPVLAGITVPNNGIDIATNSDAIVRAIFSGTVSAVFNIPGAGQNVIINHGGYRTVYSKLQDVFVSKGQTVDAKQKLGTVLTDESTGKTEAHLEIWKVDASGTKKQNPALWIYNQ
jgi:septal ring factor EnvC (AmiA/AmiB activator)